MNKIAPNRNEIYLPQYWSNPQSIVQFINASRENLLNIIPPSVFTNGFTTFPSRMGDTHFITDPEILRIILKKRAFEFPKSRANSLLLEPFVPQSIFIANGDNWREMHDIMIPVFTRSNVETFAGDIIEVLDFELSKTDLSAYSGRDITNFIQNLTYKIIARILISDTNNEDLKFIQNYFETFLDKAGRMQLWDILAIRYGFVPNLRSYTNSKIRRAFRKASFNIVRTRLRMPIVDKKDFLELLIGAYDVRNHPSEKSIQAVADNLITFLIAGHETTAMALSWGLYALSFYPDAQEKIAGESHLEPSKMAHTESALMEVMRIYPPAPMISRKTTKDEDFGALHMKPNEGIIIPILAIHRHEAHWDRPNEFDPERFLDFKPKVMTYMPFGAGPRICIGASFAMLEAKIIFSRLMREYKFTPNGHVPKANAILTLRSENGLQMGIQKRAKS